MDLSRLQEKLMIAHEAGDQKAMVRHYHQAGTLLLDQGDIDAGCFYLTQAYIHALELNDPATKSIHQVLTAHGREK